MPTPEEKYYDGMNTLLTPVRAAKSLMQTVLIILLLLGAGLLYPIIQFVNNGHVTFGGFVVSFLTALFIFTFCYAPWYTVVGSIGIFCLLFVLAAFDCLEAASPFIGLVFILFLPVGILQRYIRHRVSDPPKEPKPKRLSLAEQINQTHLERCTRKYDAMSPEDREDMTRLFGDNYLTWPEPRG